MSFVGSTPIAEYIHARRHAHGKRVQALGGAKNHMVVMPDADLDQAADALIGAAYGSAGERCMAVSVCVAVGDVADALIERLKPRIARAAHQDGMEADADMGPSVTAAHREKVLGYIDHGIAEGARLVCDGRTHAVPARERLFPRRDAVRPGHAVDADLQRGDFRAGAVRSMRVPDLAAALELVNSHEYGNGVACYTADGGTAREFARSVQRRHGRHQRADSGADGVSLVRRLEAVAVRRPPRVRRRSRALLHALQEGDAALAGCCGQQRSGICYTSQQVAVVVR